jgi:NAD(P)-dependent dehydrogenase (short-subunit alcohol dehydrogenase family)
MPDLTGKRVLILGAETDIGRAVTSAVAEAGASVAAVAATSDAEAAFAVQRLARRLSSGERKVIAQAIDATNEAAVRVMVRQVSKDLGGLDSVLVFTEPDQPARMHEWAEGLEHVTTFGWKELERRGSGSLIVVMPDAFVDTPESGSEGQELPLRFIPILIRQRSAGDVAIEVVAAIAGEARSG